MGSALIVGGTGQIGRAAAQALTKDGWAVTLAARNDASLGFPVVRVDRTVPGELEAALGDGVDLLVDVIAYTLEDARQLVRLRGRVGSVIAISSASVYADEGGLTFDSQEEGQFPRFRIPITERQATTPPGDETYSRRKRAVELALLEHEDLRATLVRPGAIYGPGELHAREWYFVKRILDGRRAIVLARSGASRFHTTSTANLAELIRLAARRPGSRVFNCADPEAPSVLEIARAIAASRDHEWAEVLLEGPERGSLGDHPWNVPTPFVLDMTEAEMLVGYRPVAGYAKAVPDTVRWLVEVAGGVEQWEEVLTGSGYMAGMFDYAAEDAFLRGLVG